MAIIEVTQAEKRYKQVIAYHDINLSIKPQEMYGLIGPDGAGKSSLIRSICSLIHPDKGSIQVLGYDTKIQQQEIRTRIGYMPQKFSLYQDLSVRQNLEFYSRLFGVNPKEKKKRMDQLFEFSRLGLFQSRKAGALSGGMKQKLALCCNLIHTPQLLILDEPTFGVDPLSREEFWDLLKEIQHQGTTIFVTTPYMDEAEKFNRIGFMFDGSIMAEGIPSQIHKSYPYFLYALGSNQLQPLNYALKADSSIVTCQLFGDVLHVSTKDKLSEQSVYRWQQEGLSITDWRLITPSIEDVFLYYSGVQNG